jgi:hypothetical protein
MYLLSRGMLPGLHLLVDVLSMAMLMAVVVMMVVVLVTAVR